MSEEEKDDQKKETELPLGTPIVAIDLGTSRSAFCITRVGVEDCKQEIFSSKSSCPTQLKTSTTLLIKPNENICTIHTLDDIEKLWFGFDAEEKYYNMDDEEQKNYLFCKHFKMNLYKPIKHYHEGQISQEDEYSDPDPIYFNYPNGINIKLSLIIAASIKLIKESAIDILTRQSGMTVDPFNVIWVLTVPAIWSDRAKQIMRKAAFKAGLINKLQSKKLKLCLEPEAASFTVKFYHDMRVEFQDKMNDIGTKFMVADCGGGTIDITLYEITNQDPFKMREVLAPAGNDSGSTKIDYEFMNFLKELFTDDIFFLLKTYMSGQLFKLLKQWEDIKISFPEQEKYILNVSDLYELAADEKEEEGWKLDDIKDYVSTYNRKFPMYKLTIKKKKICLPPELIKSFFENPIDQTAQCISTYLEKAKDHEVKFMFLVGGYAWSPLLFDRIQKQFSFQTEVLRVAQPDVAIVRGAAIFGVHPETIAFRVSRLTYGIQSLINYNDKLEDHKKRSDQTNYGFGSKTLEIFTSIIEQGEFIEHGKKTERLPLVPFSQIQNSLELQLYSVNATIERGKSMFRDEIASSIVDYPKITIPIDQSLPPEENIYEIQIEYGETEFIGRVYKATQPDVEIDASIKFYQDVEERA